MCVRVHMCVLYNIDIVNDDLLVSSTLVRIYRHTFVSTYFDQLWGESTAWSGNNQFRMCWRSRITAIVRVYYDDVIIIVPLRIYGRHFASDGNSRTAREIERII